jgi:beta-phosphoglucomutase-like phosphatase (HAD superfamily)
VAGCLAIIEERIGRTLPDDFRRGWERRMYDAFAREVVAMPGVAEVLDGLNVPFCVASSGRTSGMAAGMRVSGFARDGLGVEGDLAAAGARTFTAMRQLPALLG